MILPILLILLGTLCSGFVAFGTRPGWMQVANGLQIICWARVLLWPLATLAGLSAAVLVGLVLARRNKAWWLIGLLPIVGFPLIKMTRPMEPVRLVENPPSVTASEAGFLRDDDAVVGFIHADQPIAIPLDAMAVNRVILLQSREKRLLVMFSPDANRAIAYTLDRELKLRDLEYVCTPAGATLLYDRRLGQFINALTGLTPSGAKPIGLRSMAEMNKCSWSAWKSLHPSTQVLELEHSTADARQHDGTRITLVATTQPVAVRSKDIADLPVNLSTPAGPLLLLRDKGSNQVRAFDRKLEDDLVARFVPNVDSRRPKAQLVDIDTNTGWSLSGAAVDGPPEYQGRKLATYATDDGLNFEVMKRWYPNLAIVEVKEESLGKPLPPEPPVRPRTRRR